MTGRVLLVGGAGALVLLAALLAVLLPLGTYTLSLAVLGLPHVLAELGYVDARFSARLGRGQTGGLAALLAGVAGLRVAGLLGWLPGPTLAALELGLVVALAALALPALARRGVAPLGVGLLLVAALATGVVAGPAPTLVVLAFLHNLTPAGFLAERLRGPARTRALLACALVFGALPVAIASGRLHAALGAGPALDATPFASAGGLERHLGAFVPAPWLDRAWAVPLFSAAAFLQVMHYAVVLHVLPRLAPSRRGPLATPGRAALVVGLAGLALLPLFALDFALARRVYGVAAALHAWLEVPVLLLALAWTGASTSGTERPRSPDGASGTTTGADHEVVAPVLVP